jgi:hypothetical protein
MSAMRFLYKKTLHRHDIAFDDLPFPRSDPADRQCQQPETPGVTHAAVRHRQCADPKLRA